MRSLFNNMPILHHQNHIRFLNRRKAMRHDERRAPIHQARKSGLNLDFRARVDGRRRFVKNQHRRKFAVFAAQHHAGNAEQLLLSLRDVAAVFGDNRVVAVGQAADVTVLSTGKMLTGTITRIAQEATVSGDLAYYEVTMTVPQDGTLAMGLSCEIRVLYQSVKNVTTVSIDAIQYDSDGKPFVYCYDRKDDIVQQRVTLGINNGSIVEIVDGIRTGEAVLIPVKNTMEMPMMHY